MVTQKREFGDLGEKIAKEYLEKYEIVHPGDDVSRYIKYQIPKLEEKIKNLQNQ